MKTTKALLIGLVLSLSVVVGLFTSSGTAQAQLFVADKSEPRQANLSRGGASFSSRKGQLP